MPSLETLIVFTAAALLLNVSPGPSNFHVMSRSIAQGPAAGAPAPQLQLLGLIVTLSVLPCDLLVAQLSARIAQRLRASVALRRWQARVSGSILIGLGAWVVMDAGGER